MKSSSKLALMAAAGILVGGVTMGSAKAADLGGDCCADLEERVAELEATTARKGNRKMSLTVSGQVNRLILNFNDGNTSKTFAGLDNRVDSTRFNFTGTAKITPRVTAGFEFSVDVGLGGISSSVSNAGGPNNGTIVGVNVPNNTQNVDGNWGADAVLAVRTANWYLTDRDLGTVTVGRIIAGGPVVGIDLAGISSGAPARPILIGGSIQFKTAAGTFSGLAIGNAAFGHCQGCDRFEGISYETPTWGGLQLRAAWGENDVATYSARYAGEFAGLLVAAGIGVQTQSRAGQIDGTSFTVSPLSGFGASSLATRPADDWGASLALKHGASGIFAQGHYAWSDFRVDAGNAANTRQSNWIVQAGIAKNWFGPGDTAVYGEYGEGKDNIREVGGAFAADTSLSTMIGFGVNQKIDAAAMELYAGWRRFSLEATAVNSAVSTFGVATGAATRAANATSFQDIDLIYAGARIRF